MRGRLGIAALVLATVMAFATCADARMAARAKFRLSGTHGYSLTFTGQSAGSFRAKMGAEMKRRSSGRALVSVQAERFVRRGPSRTFDKFAGYWAPGHFRPRRFAGRFGDLGLVRVRFHARRTKRITSRHCTGYVIKRFGVFKGPIEFGGENGYTQVFARRARGKVTIPRHYRCRRHGGGGGGDGHQVASTQLVARDDSQSTFFNASRVRGFGTEFLADTGTSHPRLSIDRFVYVPIAPMADFTFAKNLSSAHVEPPAPFSGSADFASPDSWTGDLSVSFPGQPHVPLVPGFTATLKRYPGR